MIVKKSIMLGSSSFHVVDLTHPLRLDQEVYPGDSKLKRTVFSDIKETGCHHYIHELGDHHFQPHGDAPNHQNPELIDKGFEVFDLDHSFNPAFMIDLSDSENAESIDGIQFQVKIMKADLLPFSALFLSKNAVLIRTGYDLWLEKNYPHNPEKLPYLDPEAAEYLASFNNLKVVGLDSLTVDPHGSQKAHKLLKEKFIVESMVHLYEIPESARNGFDLQTSPVRIVGATGGPVVATAFIQI